MVIGLLPGYATIGIFAPLLLALARFGQGLGLGGEWGGAALLATENAPPRKRALYGSFPQLGAPIGFFFANGTFLLLSPLLTDEQFMSWGWRVPFIFSAVLVIIGLYVRVSLHESPVFEKVAKAKTGEDPAGYAADQTCSRNRTGYVHHAGNIYAVLHHDGLLYDLQYRRRASWAWPAT